MAKLARVQIVALVLAARSLQEADRDYALGLADCWNERIEEWTYVRGTDLDRRCGVPGHYVRLAPGRQGGLRGRPGVADEKPSLPAQQAVGMEFLYLARLGAAVADDPRVRDTLRVAEALLGVDTPGGRAYHRYEHDEYGEHSDGAPFDGTGVARLWPLLVGERGHYEILAGRDPAAQTGRHPRDARARRPDSRTGVGRRHDPVAGSLPRLPRQCDAARLGPQ